LASFHVSNVWPSYSAAPSAVHGASRGIRDAMSLICWIALNASGAPVASGGIGPSGPVEA
jgi:hypothetical protein